MKKVLVLAAAFALFAAPAMAVITGSAHDLSSSTGNAVGSDNVDRICAMCHTPHAGDLSVSNAPLWNRTTINVGAAADLYNSSTLTNAAQPTQAMGSINGTDVPLCLSCHAGANMATALVNAPNSVQPTFVGTVGDTNTNADIFDGANAMTNDHPVGFNYVTAQTQDSTGLFDKATVETSMGTQAFYGAAANEMWCSSCHDVHEQGAGDAVPFLKVSNNASSLCLSCHNK